jgi:hypothetical protein
MACTEPAILQPRLWQNDGLATKPVIGDRSVRALHSPWLSAGALVTYRSGEPVMIADCGDTQRGEGPRRKR